MNNDKFKVQKDTKNRHEERILLALKESPKQFKDLTKIIKLSPRGLSEVLKRLVGKGLITKIIDKGHEAYTLTEQGQQSYKNIWYIQHRISDLKEDRANYISSNPYDGLERHLIFYNPNYKMTIEDGNFIKSVLDVESFFILNMINNIKKYNMGINELDKINEKMIIAYEIDFEVWAKKFKRVLKFINEIKNNINPLEDRDVLNEFFDIIQLSKLFNDKKFEHKLNNYLKSLLTDKELFIKIFNDVNYVFMNLFINLMIAMDMGNDLKKVLVDNNNELLKNIYTGIIDFNILDKFIKLILDNKDPLDNNEIIDKIFIKRPDGAVEYYFFDYIILAKILTIDVKEDYLKIYNYEEKEKIDQSDPNSKLKQIIYTKLHLLDKKN